MLPGAQPRRGGGHQPPPTFERQRLICLGLVASTAAILIGAHATRSEAPEGPLDTLDGVMWAFCPLMAAVAVALRIVLRARAESLRGTERRYKLWNARLIPIVQLEASVMVPAVTYFMGARPFPSLWFGAILLALMCGMVPLTDFDES
jgi:hypothetical protein